MTKTIFRIAIGTLAVALTTTVTAQFTPREMIPPEELIQYRQAGYRFMQWNMGKIKINLDRDYNQTHVEGAANAIAAIANSGMGALYAYGTEHDIGEVRTRVKPSLFENRKDVTLLARDFIAKANDLAEAARKGEQAAVRKAFGEVAEACKSCHKKYRED